MVRSLPQELSCRGLCFEVEMVVLEGGVEAGADKVLQGVGGDVSAAIGAVFVTRGDLEGGG